MTHSRPPAGRPQTPREALDALLAGNRRFVGSCAHHPNQGSWRRMTLTEGQAPFATVFGCADSRVPPELVFDAGLGDLFTVRTAGHATDPGVVGTIEYGVAHCSTKVLVVLGHEGCGAVAAAIAARRTGELPSGFIGELLQRVLPSVDAAAREGREEAHEVVAEHVRLTVRELVRSSDVIAAAVDRGDLAVVGARYSLAGGEVGVVEALGELGKVDLTSIVTVQAERAAFAAETAARGAADPTEGLRATPDEAGVLAG